MKVTLESTTKIVEINGEPHRVWEGTTARGARCHAYIRMIWAHKDEDQAEFLADLDKLAPPSPDIQAIPLRMIV